MNKDNVVTYNFETKEWGLFYNVLLIDTYEDFLAVKAKMMAKAEATEAIIREYETA